MACEDFDAGVIMDEVSDDNAILPLWEGKVVGKVKKIEWNRGPTENKECNKQNVIRNGLSCTRRLHLLDDPHVLTILPQTLEAPNGAEL